MGRREIVHTCVLISTIGGLDYLILVYNGLAHDQSKTLFITQIPLY